MRGNDQLRISNEGLDLIRHFEGCYTTKYTCPAGVWTIGYGHTRSGIEESPITRERADQLLLEDMPIYEAEIKGMVTVQLRQHEFDALVSLAFNVGGTKLARSRTIAELNAGNLIQMKVEWAEWRKADGVVMPGLVRRRDAEIDMFSGIDWRDNDLKQPQVVDDPLPAPEAGPAIRVGTRHPEVSQIKAALRHMGYQFDEESYFSGAVAGALERFQKDRGLRADGVFGRKTAQALLDSLKSANDATPSTSAPQASITSFPNGNDAPASLQSLVAGLTGTNTDNNLLGTGLQILGENPKLKELSTLIPALISATQNQQTNSTAGSSNDAAAGLQSLVAGLTATNIGNNLLETGLQILGKNRELNELSTLIPALISATQDQQTNSTAGSSNDAAAGLQSLVAGLTGTNIDKNLLGAGLQILGENPKLKELSTLIPALIGATQGEQTNSTVGSIIDIAGTAASIFFPAAGPIIGLAKTFAGELFRDGRIQKSEYDEVMRSIDQMASALTLMTTPAQRGYQNVMQMNHTQVTNTAIANGWVTNSSTTEGPAQ